MNSFPPLHRLLSVVILALTAPFALAQSGPVTKTTAGAAKNDLVENFNIGSGRTVTIKAGGELDASAGTLTLADGQLAWSKLTTTPTTLSGYGITDAQPLDADLTDLADGSLTGSKVGSGINADNITTGTVADARIASTIARDSEVTAAVAALTATDVTSSPSGDISATTVQGAINELSTNLTGAYAAVAGVESDFNLFANAPSTHGDFDAASWRTDLGLANGVPLIKPYALAASPCLTKTGAGTISVKAGTKAIVNGTTVVTFASNTPATIDTGSLTAGTDYAVYATAAGGAVFSLNFASPPTGFTADQVQLIGGFHYAPGGNATGLGTGGDTTPAINAYSIWDLKFRPACPDPRGMALVADRFWVDIYLCNTTPDTLGTSANDATIADGSSPPRIPARFGGNGSTTYGGFTGFEATELMAAYGKQLLSWQEAQIALFGSSEGVSRGNDAVKSGLGTANAGSTNTDEKFTSMWGMVQATGVMHVWFRDISFKPYTAALTGTPPADTDFETWINAAKAGGYKAITESRGSVYTFGTTGTDGAVQGLGGGSWSDGSNAGSRCASWNNAPSNSLNNIGARGRSDHLVLP